MVIALNRTVQNRPIPFDWVVCQIKYDVLSYRHLLSEITVTETAHTEQSRRWLHVSVSHPRRLPTPDELDKVKDIWFGEHRDVYQLLSDSFDVNTFHLYCPLNYAPFGGAA